MEPLEIFLAGALIGFATAAIVASVVFQILVKQAETAPLKTWESGGHKYAVVDMGEFE